MEFSEAGEVYGAEAAWFTGEAFRTRNSFPRRRSAKSVRTQMNRIPSMWDAACGWKLWKFDCGCVDIVHTFAVGLGRMRLGSDRTPHVSAGSHCLQGLECRSSPPRARIPPVRGGFAFNVCTLTLRGSL